MREMLITLDREVYYRNSANDVPSKILGFTVKGVVLELSDKSTLYCNYFPYSSCCYIIDEYSKEYENFTFKQKNEAYNKNREVQDYIFTKLREIEKLKKGNEEAKKKTLEYYFNEFISIIKSKDFSDTNNLKSLCCSLFITDSGHVNFNMINKVKKECPNVSIYAGKKDSFGWLTGILAVDDNEIVVFG